MGLIARVTSHQAARARHNDFDYECVYWAGDRRPDATRLRFRNMDGTPTMVWENRCGVCNPHTELEADALIDFELTGELPPGHEWFGSVLVVTTAPQAEPDGHR